MYVVTINGVPQRDETDEVIRFANIPSARPYLEEIKDRLLNHKPRLNGVVWCFKSYNPANLVYTLEMLNTRGVVLREDYVAIQHVANHPS